MSASTWWRGLWRRPAGDDPSHVLAPDASLDHPQLAGHLANLVLASYLRDRRSDLFWRRLKGLAVVLFGLAGVIAAIAARWPADLIDLSMNSLREKVGVIRIEGPISADGLASAAKILPAVERAFEDGSVKTVALHIDSPGGAPGEAERIYRGLDKLRLKHGKPVVAVINNLGTSAAYLIALHADRIVAGQYSMVGSIGAKLTAWDLHRAAANLDVTSRTFASGPLKNMLDPFEPPSAEATHKAQALVDEIAAIFVREVKTRRGAKLPAGANYASGEVWTGEQAKALGLIDDIGTLDTAFADLPLRQYGPARPRSIFAPEASAWLGALFESLALAVHGDRAFVLR